MRSELRQEPHHSGSVFHGGLPVSSSRCLLGPRPRAELYAGADLRGRTGAAVAGAAAGTAPGVGAGAFQREDHCQTSPLEAIQMVLQRWRLHANFETPHPQYLVYRNVRI